jgi:hypothetical protein
MHAHRARLHPQALCPVTSAPAGQVLGAAFKPVVSWCARCVLPALTQQVAASTHAHHADLGSLPERAPRARTSVGRLTSVLQAQRHHQMQQRLASACVCLATVVLEGLTQHALRVCRAAMLLEPMAWSRASAAGLASTRQPWQHHAASASAVHR